MTDRDYTSDAEADEMMEDVYAETGGAISPTLTPFAGLGTSEPAVEMLDAPTSPEQAEVKDPWETFRK